jgi:hypothetical protein
MFEMRRDKLAELQARVAKLRRDARAHGVRLSNVVIRPAKKVTPNMLPKTRSGAETRAAIIRSRAPRCRGSPGAYPLKIRRVDLATTTSLEAAPA